MVERIAAGGAQTMRDARLPAKLVDFKGLKSIFSIWYSRSQLSRLEQEGQFPKRVTLGAHRAAWVEHEIIAWASAREAAKNS